MGAIRSTPENHVNVSQKPYKYFDLVVASTCGWQLYLQDYSETFHCHGIDFNCIYDGNGGPEVAEFCQTRFPVLVQRSQLIKIGQIQSGLECVLSELDELIANSKEQIQQIQKQHKLPIQKQVSTRSGCSMIICAVSQQSIVISNVGLCKSYITYKYDPKKAVLVAGNHTYANEQDESRVLKAGGFFLQDKLNGIIPFTRSLGNLQFKNNSLLKKNEQLLVCDPSVFKFRRQDINLIILGSSGLWQKTTLVLNHIANIQNKQLLKNSLKQLLESLIAKDSSEVSGLQNMTAMVLNFKNS